MGEVVNLHQQNRDALKVLVRKVLNGEINIAESIGFIIQCAKREVEGGHATWKEFGTTEDELLAKKNEAPE